VTVRKTQTSVWVILSVALTAMFGVSSFVWSIVQSQITEIRADIGKFKDDARWQYATKDFVTGKIDGIQQEEATYRKGLERLLPQTIVEVRKP